MQDDELRSVYIITFSTLPYLFHEIEMGYIAYAAGTLIAAVAIHSFYKRQTRVGDSLQKKKLEHEPLREKEVLKDFSAQDEKSTVTITPPVSIHISQDGGDSSASSERDESPPQTNRTSQGPESKKSTESLGMPPPPRPTTPSSPAQARQRDAMPPPAIVPPRNKSPPRLKPATVSSLAPPSRGPPGRQGGFTAPTGLSSLAPPPSAASAARSGSLQPPRTSLGVPQQKVLANTKMQPSLAPSTSTQAPAKRASKKVLLAPGHSPLDWAALTKSTAPDTPLTLRGEDASAALGPHRLGRVTPSQLKKQTGRKGKDAWTSYQGRVYNISAYLNFHPGGGDELMKGAGRSSDALFAEVHPWVNWDGMLSGCLIGMLVSEDDPAALGREVAGESQNELDEMD